MYIYKLTHWLTCYRNLKVPLIVMILTAGISYPFPGASLDFVLLRIPALLMVAIISAVEFDRLYGRNLSFREQLQLVPSSVGMSSGFSGRSYSPQGSDVFANMSGGRETPSNRDCRSEISTLTDGSLEEGLKTPLPKAMSTRTLGQTL